jgi:hypothetical protein
MRGCAGSSRPRLASVGNSRVFFEPGHRDLALAHVLGPLRRPGCLSWRRLPKPCGEEAGSLAWSMLRPLGHRGRMDPRFAGTLVAGLLPVERFDRQAGLACCPVTRSLCQPLLLRLRLRDTAMLPELPV